MKGRDSLDVFDFGVLLQALAQSGRVGNLRVSSGPREKFIQIARGRVDAVYTRRSRFRIGRILYNHRALDLTDLRPVLEAQQKRQTKLHLGEELLRRGLVTEEQLREGLRYQLCEELLEIFFWKEPSYEFLGGDPAQVLGPRARELVRVGGSFDAGDLLLRVTKSLDDIEKFNRVLPSLKDVYELGEDPEEYLAREGIGEEARELLRLLDGRRDLRDVLREMRMNRFDVLEYLYRFRTDGLIRAKNGFELLMLAENALRNEDKERLARVYERVLELGVEGFDVHLRLARVYEQAERREDAAVRYVEYAKKALREGDLVAAEDGASRAMDVYPGSRSLRELRVTIRQKAQRLAAAVEDLRVLAEQHADQGEADRSLATIERALALAPGDPGLEMDRVRLLDRLGRPLAAGHACTRIGRARLAAGDLQGAEDAHRFAIRLNPRSVWFRNRLLCFLTDNGRRNHAVAEIGELVSVLRESPASRPGSGRRLLRCLHRRLESLGGRNSTAMVGLAEGLLGAGDPAAALDVLRSAGAAQVEAGRFGDAVETFGRAVEIAPDDPALREILARAHSELGEKEKALAQFRRAARLHAAGGGRDAAERVYREMLRVDPFAPEALRELAVLLADGGKREEGARRLALVGHLYRAAGRPEDAVEYYDRACSLDPGNADNLRTLAEGLGEVLQMERSVDSLRRLFDLLRAQGRHAAAIDAGQRILEMDGTRTEVRALLRNSLQALAADLAGADADG